MARGNTQSFCRRVVIFSLVLATVSASAASMREWSLQLVARVGGCLAHLTERPLIAFTHDHSGRQLSFNSSATGDSFDIQLGRRLGSGFYGGFYLVERSTLPDVADVGFAFGVKIPHTFFGTRQVMWHARKKAAQEFELYGSIQAAIPRIEAQKAYPKTPAWNLGQLPIVPIFATTETPQGRFLFKPIVNGKFLRDIATEIKKDGELPSHYRISLLELFALTQAVYQATGMSPDIRPPNFVFVDDPKTMRIMGLNRPSFVLFEMSQVPFNLPKYLAHSTPFEEFEREFLDYLQDYK